MIPVACKVSVHGVFSIVRTVFALNAFGNENCETHSSILHMLQQPVPGDDQLYVPAHAEGRSSWRRALSCSSSYEVLPKPTSRSWL